MLFIIIMSKNVSFYFTNHHIKTIFGISRKVLSYWRKIGLFSASLKTDGGHYRYSFSDMVALKTITELKDKGISTNQLKRISDKQRNEHIDIKTLFTEKSLYIIGKEIIIADKKMPFDPLTGQGTFLRNHDMKKWVIAETLNRFEIPMGIEKGGSALRQNVLQSKIAGER